MKTTVAVGCLTVTLFALGEETSLIRNGGFETTNATGKAEGWWMPAPYAVERGVGRGGGAGMVFEAKTSQPYVVPSQEFPAVPGGRYKASVWVKLENVRNGRANVCLEWYDKSGRWLDGAYHQGCHGTRDWVRLQVVSPRLPVDAVKLTVGVYATQGACGRIVYDDVQVESVPAAAVGGLYSDAFRNRAADGEVTFFADLNLLASGLATNGIRGVFSLPGKNGVRQIPAASIDETVARVTVPVADLQSGTVSFSLQDLSGREEGTASLSFTRLPAWPDKGVWVDRHRRLIVDGKPFFPLGMYWMGVTASDLDTYRKGPFNCLMPYARLDRRQLDLCAARGLKALYNIKDYYAFHMRGKEGIVTPEDASRAVARIVAEFKDHPALLGWYPNDEIGLEHREELEARQRQLERIDPDHPSWTMLFQVSQMRDYLPMFDICGSDPYPFESRNFEHPYFWPKLQRETTFGSRPIWQAVKVHDHSAYFRPDEREKILAEPVPTLEEIRNMTWQALCAGANGIFFYSFFDMKKMDWKSPFEKRFAEVCKVASELKKLEDVFLSTEQPLVVKGDGEKDRKFACNAWRYRGETYVAVVNLTWKPVSGTVSLGERFSGVEKLLGETLDLVDGRSLAVKLPDRGLAVLKLK